MTYHHEDARPGCFGQALTFSDRHTECRCCPFAGECEPEHRLALQRLREAHGIKVKERQTPPPSSPIDPQSQLAKAGMALPKKVDELLARLDRAGVRVSEPLRRGENPFDRRFAFLRVAAHLLIHLPQGVSRDALILGLERKLNWSRGTAAAHATQAFQALCALGVAEDFNGRLHIKR